MPIDPRPHPRPPSSEPACRAVVAARLHAPEREEPLLRRLRVRAMLGGLLDDPAMIAAAAARGRRRPRGVAAVRARRVEAALSADIAAARIPSSAARRSTTSSAGRPEERRYTAPSYELSRGDGR